MILKYERRGKRYDKSSGRKFIDKALSMSDNVRLLVGMSYFMECKPGCQSCAKEYNMRVDRLTDTIRILDIPNVRVNAESHLKYYRIGKRVWIGGINLSGSKWTDVATEIYDEDAKEELNKIFNEHWDNSTIYIEQFKKDVPIAKPIVVCSQCKEELTANVNGSHGKYCSHCGIEFEKGEDSNGKTTK